MGEAGCLRDGKFQNLHVDGANNILNNVNLAGNLSVGGTLETQELPVNNNLINEDGDLIVPFDLEVIGAINNPRVGGLVTYSSMGELDNGVLVGNFSQPAGTFIKDIFFVNESELRTAEGQTSSLNFVFSDGGTDILTCSGILVDLEEWPANTPLPIIKDGLGNPANAFAPINVVGTAEYGFLTASPYSVNGRNLEYSIDQTKVTTTGNINVIITFMYVNQP